MAASNTRFTQNSLGQSKNLIDSDHGIYRYGLHLVHLLTAGYGTSRKCRHCSPTFAIGGRSDNISSQ